MSRLALSNLWALAIWYRSKARPGLLRRPRLDLGFCSSMEGQIGPFKILGALTRDDREEVFRRTGCVAAFRRHRHLVIRGPVHMLEEARAQSPRAKSPTAQIPEARPEPRAQSPRAQSPRTRVQPCGSHAIPPAPHSHERLCQRQRMAGAAASSPSCTAGQEPDSGDAAAGAPSPSCTGRRLQVRDDEHRRQRVQGDHA